MTDEELHAKWAELQMIHVIEQEILQALPQEVRNGLKDVSMKDTGVYAVWRAKQDPTKIGFFPLDRMNHILIPQDELTQRGMMTKPGRMFTRICGWTGYTPTTKGTEAFLAKYLPATEVTLVSGEEIRTLYHHSQYAEESTGTLANSCMRYDFCQEYFDVYVDNPEHVQMACMMKDEKVWARAILWTLTRQRDGKTVRLLDRVYGTDIAQKQLHIWAEKENIEYIKDHSGERGELPMMTFTAKREYDLYPYMDTMFGLSEDKLTLSSTYDHFTLQDTDGTFSNVECAQCGERIPEEDTVYVNNIGMVCQACIEDSFVWIESMDEYVEIHNATCCASCDTWIRLCDSTETVDGTMCETCREAYVYIPSLDEYFHIDDATMCTVCEEFFPSEEITDGVCETCQEEKDETEKAEKTKK